MYHRFYGGIRPAEQKSATEHSPIAVLDPAPARVTLPLEGRKALVTAAETVLLGQKVAEGTGILPPLCASVSGRVVAVEAGGCLVLESDGSFTPAPFLLRPEKPTAEETIALVYEAGIVGLGGGSFPTHEKLRQARGMVDTLILNGMECEPYCTADGRLMEEQPEKVIGGGRILMAALGLAKCTIAVGGDKTSAASALQAHLPLRGGDICVKTLRARYPLGAEGQLVQRITGRKVPPGGLPQQVRCVVFNVATAAAVYDGVHDGKPLTKRVVAVTGSALEHPQNVWVPLGTAMSFLAERAKVNRSGPVRLLVGGPMRGKAQYDLEEPVRPGTNCLAFLKHGDYLAANRRETACLHCGKCLRVCPVHLLPLEIHRSVLLGRDPAEFYPQDCMECGACAYGCPARIPLVQSIRKAKIWGNSEAAAEEPLIEDVSAEDVPMEEVPVADVPVEEVHVENVLVEEVPVEEAPVKEAPVVPVQAKQAQSRPSGGHKKKKKKGGGQK